MIVLDENECRCVASLFKDGARKDIVDFAIGPPFFRVEGRPGEDDMTERPQTLVGETVVIQSFLLLGEPHAPQSETRLTGRQRYAILGVYHRTICITATMGN